MVEKSIAIYIDVNTNNFPVYNRRESVHTCRRGQLSWAWVFIVVTIGLVATSMLYILLEQTRLSSAAAIASAGTDPAKTSLLNSLWLFVPILVVGGWFFYIIIMAAATRGGDIT